MLRASTMGVGEMLKYLEKGCLRVPQKNINFMLAFNHARLHDGATTSKIFPARKAI